ncbi:hypothetical protein IWW36_003966 [Coemansia brasiliensis]|uniref:RPA-interacting protein N-terminal domain-containing protein n=1 Tax=Coemansia brasiliensis TaxID=2650707 RepID=A0A9W8LZ91_9FUNG|nr:hypothetical protein IWW36_003966 [Coemansia brasiliensis]
MDSQQIFSSPPRPAPTSFVLGQMSKSGGNSQRRTRRTEYKNLSSSSRAARAHEQPWRKRFREQCVERLSKARDEAFMVRRQLTQMAKPQAEAETQASLTEEEICAIVQQEWARFRTEMEQQSMEYGVLDEEIIGEIGEDLDWGCESHGGQAQEFEEWDAYENQLLEDAMMEAELMQVDMVIDEHDLAQQ